MARKEEPRPNQLDPSLLSVTALNPWPGNISSPRLQMFNSQLTQALYTKGNNDRRCITGMETKFAKTTFGIRAPHDMHVIRIIHRYPKTVGYNSIKENPETIVVYEYDKTLPNGRIVKEVDYISCPTHHDLHQHFGFRYNYQTKSFDEYIPEGETIAQSPSVSPEGNYRFGSETNVAMMSVPQIIEDGVVASKSFCKKMVTMGLETFAVSWGKNKYPLNIYGDVDEYKIFPDIGDRVRDDGVLMALREYNDMMAPVQMSRSALREPDYKYDELVFVEPGAKVVDVRIVHDERIHHIRGKSMNTPQGMSEQPLRYLTADKTFHQNVLNVYNSLRSAQKNSLHISPRFHALLVEANAVCAQGDKQRMVRTYRGVPIDEWRVEIKLEYDIEPTIGFKLSAAHGD